MRIWGSNVVFAGFMYVFWFSMILGSWISHGAIQENIIFTCVGFFTIAMHASGFLFAKWIAAEHGISLREAFDIELLRWFRPRTLLPT